MAFLSASTPSLASDNVQQFGISRWTRRASMDIVFSILLALMLVALLPFWQARHLSRLRHRFTKWPANTDPGSIRGNLLFVFVYLPVIYALIHSPIAFVVDALSLTVSWAQPSAPVMYYPGVFLSVFFSPTFVTVGLICGIVQYWTGSGPDYCQVAKTLSDAFEPIVSGEFSAAIVVWMLMDAAIPVVDDILVFLVASLARSPEIEFSYLKTRWPSRIGIIAPLMILLLFLICFATSR